MLATRLTGDRRRAAAHVDVGDVGAPGVGDDVGGGADAAEQRHVDRVAGDLRVDLAAGGTSRRASWARRGRRARRRRSRAPESPASPGCAPPRRRRSRARAPGPVMVDSSADAAIDAARHAALEIERRASGGRDRSGSRRRRSSRGWCRSSARGSRLVRPVARLVISKRRGSPNSNVPLPSKPAAIACGLTLAMSSAVCASSALPRRGGLADGGRRPTAR